MSESFLSPDASQHAIKITWCLSYFRLAPKLAMRLRLGRVVVKLTLVNRKSRRPTVFGLVGAGAVWSSVEMCVGAWPTCDAAGARRAAFHKDARNRLYAQSRGRRGRRRRTKAYSFEIGQNHEGSATMASLSSLASGLRNSLRLPRRSRREESVGPASAPPAVGDISDPPSKSNQATAALSPGSGEATALLSPSTSVLSR